MKTIVTRSSLVSFVSLVGFLSTYFSCKSRNFSADVRAKSSDESQADWSTERATREEALQRYLDGNEGFKWFRDFPNGSSGLPVIFLRSIASSNPELASILGENDAKFAKFGLGPHPIGGDYPFPLGLGWSQSKDAPINLGTLTCAACHIGRVIGPDNKVKLLVGAPNTQFDSHSFVASLVKAALSENFTFENMKIAIEKNKKNGWLYGTQKLFYVPYEKFETFLVNRKGEAMVEAIKKAFAEREAKIAAVRNGPYKERAGGSLDGGNPGRADAGSVAIALISEAEDLRKPGLLAPDPAMVDIMSVWQQKDRAAAQWDGFLKDPLMRNLGAELGVTGDPAKVDVKNAVITKEFLQKLPPPPYPFAVNTALAAAGKTHFEKHCSFCHKPLNTEPVPLKVIGTDPNRANGFTTVGMQKLNEALREACPKSEPQCNDIPAENMGRLLDENKKGYMAAPLDGIWARAPYLHNGSVPTLMHLLVPELREKDEAKVFWRGNIDFDQNWVGFAWRTNKAPAGFTDDLMLKDREFIVARQYDTSLRGNSNKGHEKNLRNDGKKWSAEGEETDLGRETLELLEYLKTL